MARTNRTSGRRNARNIRSRAAGSSSRASARMSSSRPAARPATGHGMSRRRFLRTSGLAAAGVGAAAMGLGESVKGQSIPVQDGSIIVHPIGDVSESYPHPLAGLPGSPVPAGTLCTLDVLFVQLALLGKDHNGNDVPNFNGMVLLKSHKITDSPATPTAFEFAAGSVFVISDIEISGEVTKDKKGNIIKWHTEINGGAEPFTIVAPVQTTIENLHFENFHNSAIFAIASAGATIRNNEIQHPVGGFPANIFLPEEQLLGFGVDPNTPIGFGILFIGNYPGFSITGAINIDNNEIEMSESTEENPRMDLGMGLFIMDAHLQVTNNTIKYYEFNGMGIVDNLGSTVISGNNINGPEKGIWPVGSCIETGGGVFIPGNDNGSYLVDRNSVLVRDPEGIGIMIDDQTVGAVVTNNDVQMQGGLYGISIWGGRDHIVKNNKISGYGMIGIGTLPWNTHPTIIPNFSIENVSFVGNNTARFKAVPGAFNVFFGAFELWAMDPAGNPVLFGPWTTNNCTWVGYSGIAFDDPRNSGNKITGYEAKSMAGGAGIGPEMAEAMHLRRELLKNLKNII